MPHTAPQFLSVDRDGLSRRLAYLHAPGTGPTVVWLGGFRSDMRATKAEALAAACAEDGRGFLRFDYTGHGESEGRFADATISTWLDDALALIAMVPGAPVLVGSSMGGWIALLAARRLAALSAERKLSGLVLIAPAVDFTERLMWDAFPDDVRAQITRDGVWYRPSAYSPEPYPITRALIEDGRRHLMLDQPIDTGCRVHILQGMQDPDVPWRHAMALVERLPADDVTLTLVKDGDHRLSRPQDIALLVDTVRAVSGR